eukprot:438574-Pyramimonas_sp.AAC.1
MFAAEGAAQNALLARAVLAALELHCSCLVAATSAAMAISPELQASLEVMFEKQKNCIREVVQQEIQTAAP